MWKSVAKWPDEVKGLGNTSNITEDLHETREQAEAVCNALRLRGFGGKGEVFPCYVEVEQVTDQ